MLRQAVARQKGATVFGYQVKDPERFGAVEFDEQKRAISLEEKPFYIPSQILPQLVFIFMM